MRDPTASISDSTPRDNRLTQRKRPSTAPMRRRPTSLLSWEVGGGGGGTRLAMELMEARLMLDKELTEDRRRLPTLEVERFDRRCSLRTPAGEEAAPPAGLGECTAELVASSDDIDDIDAPVPLLDRAAAAASPVITAAVAGCWGASIAPWACSAFSAATVGSSSTSSSSSCLPNSSGRYLNSATTTSASATTRIQPGSLNRLKGLLVDVPAACRMTARPGVSA